MDWLRVTEASANPLEGYHFAWDQLVLDLPGGREVSLECRCGRHHWLVVPPGLALQVTCHGCGTRASLPLAPGSWPGPGMQRML